MPFAFNPVKLHVIAVFLVAVMSAQAQPAPRQVSTDARLLKNTLLEKHVQPRTIDNTYSTWVYDHVILQLDPEKIYFSKEDLNVIAAYREMIDDDLNGNTWNFVPQLTQLYKNCIQRYQAGINELATHPTDFTATDHLADDSTVAPNPGELKKRWGQVFRYNVLDRLLSLQSKIAEKTEKEFLAQYEKVVRQQVQKVMNRDAGRILNDPLGFDTYVAAEFFNVMAAAFDPHTTYFSAQQVQNFITSLSMQGYYFGITLRENDRGEVTIGQIMPGGPAWKSGEVHIGDVLLALRWEGQEPIDLWSVDLNEVNDMLEETNHSLLAMTLRKPDGTVTTVSMRKEKIESEESAVKSFVLTGDHKVGYISLPAFYTDWGAEDGAKCANDVAREIFKLKKENIEGLILDVRFNGGGSMMEAVAMAGIFIDGGPVVVVKNRAGELSSIKDMNRGTIYDGPMVLMVNGLSASASEILAAALQDYHRAIIVGGNTYGKATAQQLFPLEPKQAAAKPRQPASPGMTENVNYASITMERLYRITGKTAQRIGVIPDIRIPDAIQVLPIRENSLPGAFPSDSVLKKTYYQPLAVLPLQSLREKSEKRIAQQPKFASLETYSARLLDLEKKKENISLSWSDFKKNYANEKELVKDVRQNASQDVVAFHASKMKDEEQRMQMDNYVDEFNKAWIKNLQSDIFLNEAFLIICDFIPFVTKK